MSVEGVCNPVCGVEKDEDGIRKGGTTRVCNPVGGG